MTMESMLSTESCLMEDQSGQDGADALPAEESLRASIAMDTMDTMEMEAAAAVSGVQAKLPNIHRSIQCRGATAMARGKHNIDTIVLHTPEGFVPGTMSVLSGTRAGFDWYLPPSGELYKCNDYLRYFSWHAGDLGYNRRSIGIEQWDFAAKMASAPDAHYQRLARLCAYLVETLDLAIRHAKNYGEYGFIAHGVVTPHSRWDPGKFDYEKLLSLVSDLVKGRPEDKLDPVDENPLNGGTQKKIWLPGLQRISAGTFDEGHLGKAHVMTLDGSDRAVIVPKGVAMHVPKPGEGEAPVVIVEPDDPNGLPIVEPEGKRLAAVIDGYFASLPSNLAPYAPVGAIIYDEAKKANLHITSACALVEQESAGRNVFGADWGTRHADIVPFAHLPVTKVRVQKLVAHVRAGGVSNGVGLTQITWRDFIYDAEKRGGAHLPKNQCAVGFDLLSGYYGRYPYLEAVGAYNAGESNRRSVIQTYSAQFAKKHAAWRARLGVAGEAPPETPEIPETPNAPSDPNTPHGKAPHEVAPHKEAPHGEKPPGGTPHGEAPPEESPHGETPPEETPPKEEAPVTAPPEAKPPDAVSPVTTAPPVAKPPVVVSPVTAAPPVTPSAPAKAPGLGKAAKAVVAAAVPLIGALLLWVQTGALNQTEISVGLAGLLTALLVYFVPNATDAE